MPDKKYRFTVQENTPKFVPDLKGGPGAGWYEDNWKNLAQVEGSAKLIADALRSTADELDPGKPVLRSHDKPIVIHKSGGE